jgi:hypothetical protein
VGTVFCADRDVLVVIKHGRRRVHIAGITAHPAGARMLHMPLTSGD